MESGKHRISLKLVGGEKSTSPYGLGHMFGLVRDGAAWDKAQYEEESTDAWFMSGTGALYGNGKYGDEEAGFINDGQIVSMEADLDKGTLRFWVDGKQRGPGYESGATGRLRWAVSLFFTGGAVEIVPTPKIQPWTIDNCSVGSNSKLQLEFLHDVQIRVIQIFQSHRGWNSESGVSIQAAVEVLAPLGITEPQIRAAIEYLSGEGHIYCTVDENHYKSTM